MFAGRETPRLGLSPARYRSVVVFGGERLSDPEFRQVHAITGIALDTLRGWQQRSTR